MPLYLSTRFSFFATEYRLSPASQLLSLLPLSSSSLLLFLHLLPPSLGCYISLPVTLTDLMRRGGATVCSALLPTHSRSSSPPLFLSSPLFIGSHPYSLLRSSPILRSTTFSPKSSTLFSSFFNPHSSSLLSIYVLTVLPRSSGLFGGLGVDI